MKIHKYPAGLPAKAMGFRCGERPGGEGAEASAARRSGAPMEPRGGRSWSPGSNHGYLNGLFHGYSMGYQWVVSWLFNGKLMDYNMVIQWNDSG